MFEIASVEYSEGGTTCEGCVATSQSGRRPTVLLAPDWVGLHEGMKAVAGRVAELGYTCFGLDFYGTGVLGAPGADNSHLMGPLLADRAMLRRRLLAGLASAAKHPAVDSSRIAVIGYCLGGLCALDLARAAAPELKAAVSFHGILKAPDIGPQAPITAKVLVLHGWEDPMAPPADVTAFAQEMTDAKADWQLHAYGNTMHAFTIKGTNAPQMGLAYSAAADRRSWQTMRNFLDEVFA
jgi:dienelactone hydrolase